MITNKTKNRIISKEEIVCRNIFSQSLGLMFRKKQNLVMIFDKERKVCLHNFFVFFPTDVFVLDKNKKIVEIKRNFRPFSFWNSSRKGKYVIELGENGCDKSKIGDKISF
ncbi:MAG: DUF192 domain-containing protein [Nanoarchaeota archaeon]